MPQFTKYGLLWNDEIDDALKVELFMIEKGGRWLGKNGQTYGLGLFQHHKNAQQLLWPTDDWHRWVELSLKEICANKITTIIGPGSSGKTYIASKFALVDYWSNPNTTCTLISSTDVRGLELRVWGRIKDLLNRAVDRYPYLPGQVLESMHAIATDDIEEDKERARVLNRGIICIPCLQSGRYVGMSKYLGIKQLHLRLIADECFPGDTLIDTPKGFREIQTLKPGGLVLSAIGADTIKSVIRKRANTLVRIITADGRIVICTPEHPILTETGWEKACDLRQGQYMVAQHEAVQILRDTDQQSNVLQQVLRREVLHNGPGSENKVLHQKEGYENRAFQTTDAQRSPGICRGAPATPIEKQLYERSSCLQEGEQHIESNGLEACNSWRQRHGANKSGGTAADCVPESDLESCDKNSNEARERLSSVLSSGRGVSERKVGGRSGRTITQCSHKKSKGCQKNVTVGGSRVESVEISKPSDFGIATDSEGTSEVYNLSVEGHPSYSVMGFLVHNCQAMGPNFLDATSNLGSNPDFKAVFLGNPNDPLDPLGMAAEPLDGWSSMPEPTETKVWNTRFQGGRCVNLVGTDSPNNESPDPDKPLFPYLIHRKRIEEIAAFWTTDSQQYYSQAVGIMKTGLLARRVITRDLCVEHHALEKAVWGSGEIKKVYAIDAAYSGTGGDRCVAGFIEFGKDIDGTQIIRVNPPSIIPISIRINKQPEDQIAEYVKKDIENHGIAASDIFYDSTGRGTLGSAFARLFGATTPVPVEFGGKPSKRPVRHDLFIFDGQEKRHKRCDEHFLDFVSELWIESRYIIECDQLRELPEDVMKEGCGREYGEHKKKMFVESKHDPKARERMIRSPDLYDWLVCSIEGARQRGFKIMRLGSSVIVESDPYRWLSDRRKSAVKLLQSKSLSFK